MIEKSHIEGGEEHLSEVQTKRALMAHENKLQAQAEKKAAESKKAVGDALEYYLGSSEYTEVHIVRCDQCKADLCLEVLDPKQVHMWKATHHQGRRRITLGDSMMSHRKRLDGVMGYKCICGNNTINSSVELGELPTVKSPSGPAAIPIIEPHHEAAVRNRMARENYKADTETNGAFTRIESFTIERIK